MEEKRDSQHVKESLENWSTDRAPRKSDESYDEYLVAMKRAHHHASIVPTEMMSPRARYRHKQRQLEGKSTIDMDSRDLHEAVHISTIASMVPDEIIYKHSDYSMRSYETALMFIDVSGFTDLCEMYTKTGRGGPSKLTQVLNSYIGAMVQEILTHNGDVLKFAGDAFLSMWKKTSRLTMQDVVHTAIDCGLIIQKNYGTHVTDLGVTLKVKVAISAGVSHFAIIGDENMASYVIIGQPVWDAKAAEYMSTAGDVLTSASAWMYVNEAEYCTQPCGDGRHTKVLGVGVTWKRVEKIDFASSLYERREPRRTTPRMSRVLSIVSDEMDRNDLVDNNEMDYREFSLRPAVISALKSSWWPCLRRFMVTPVLRAVDNDEPMDFLTEVRHVVVVFLNIITKTVTEDVLIDIVDSAYRKVCSVVSESSGLVNKVSMFDKDMMFLVVFGLRGLKHEDEAQKALLCAFQLQETLQDPNVTTVSIGVTSGRTYCGVVGHVLRREYTVIGSPVNKAARLMMSYVNKVTCDKETFVRSKLDLDFFRLMEPKFLKGIAKPGPIYEFNKSGWPDRMTMLRHPILGRNEEMRKYKDVLNNAIDHQKESFTKYRDMRYGVIILGPRLVGKKRLMDEYLNMTPSYMRPEKVTLTAANTYPYAFTRMLLRRLLIGGNDKEKRDAFENRIRYSLGTIELSPIQIHAVNTMFKLRFPLPETFSYTGDLLAEPCVKDVLYKIFTNRFDDLRVVAVKDGQFIDDQSWRVLLILMETKSLFVIMTINDYDKVSKVAKNCISNNIFVRIQLSGIDQWYHAALACQLLDVQAIPADLEKVMESASGGLPGWIQNFVISLIQRGELSVVTVPRSEAVEAGAVMPSAALLLRPGDKGGKDVDVVSTITESSYQSTVAPGKHEGLLVDSENIQMAVLAENYNFDDMKVDMTMDVIILKTYDSLTPFEKMMLKCGSVLGDVFSRRMLLHLLQSDSPRKVAQAVAKLFEIRVLECEGGDFTRDTSMVLIHPAPTTMPAVKPPYCCCLGTRAPPHCRDLPMYSFCGYMKFRHSLFRTTTYELLTENQKREMHRRALLYLERYTRRCTSCGAGCFTKLFGVRCDDGLVSESKQLKRVRQQISALSAETRMTSENLNAGITSIHNSDDLPNYNEYEAEAEKRRLSHSAKMYRKTKRVRSYSSLELENCECLPILLTVYNQVIDHCRAVGECEKLFETYLEYVDLSLLNVNIPQAIRLLFEVEEEIVKASTHCGKELCKLSWIKEYRLARILTSRGACMLESGDYGEARRHLLQAMKLYRFPFPTTSYKRAICNAKASFHQLMAMYVCPRMYIERETGWSGQFYDYICWTLIKLHKLFIEEKEFSNAELAAKWSLEFSTKSNSTFRLLCVSYANMISIYRQEQKFSRCVVLEKRVMDICHRKRGQLDITEVHAVCTLYTSIFLFYVEYGKKVESLEFGLSVIPMLSCLPDITSGQLLVLWMLKLLLSDLRIHEMVMIMREFFYMTDHYDLSSETWYYYYSIVILLDTGYCVEQFGSCEKFYIKKGDAILRSKTPEAAWNFFACMWLVTIRIGAWERSLLWEEKIKQILMLKFQKHEFNIMILVRVVEGFLIALVNEVDNRNIKKILMLEKNIKSMFHHINDACRHVPMFRPRYFLMYAYYHFLRGKRTRAHKYLNRAAELCRQYDHATLQVWIEHTRNHWRGTLNPKFVDYWSEHIEAGNLLDYKDFDADKGVIIPYTLPLPRDFEK